MVKSYRNTHGINSGRAVGHPSGLGVNAHGHHSVSSLTRPGGPSPVTSGSHPSTSNQEDPGAHLAIPMSPEQITSGQRRLAEQGSLGAMSLGGGLFNWSGRTDAEQQAYMDSEE